MQLDGNGEWCFDGSLALVVQEISDYFVFDRPFPLLDGKWIPWRELAQLNQSHLAGNPAFLNLAYTRLCVKIAKAYDTHCVERVSVLSAHDLGKFLIFYPVVSSLFNWFCCFIHFSSQ
jgi:hypothetical protein